MQFGWRFDLRMLEMNEPMLADIISFVKCVFRSQFSYTAKKNKKNKITLLYWKTLNAAAAQSHHTELIAH